MEKTLTGLAQRYYEQLPAYEKDSYESAESALYIALRSLTEAAGNIYCALSTKEISATIFTMYATSAAQKYERQRQAEAVECVISAVQSIIAEVPTINALEAAFKEEQPNHN